MFDNLRLWGDKSKNRAENGRFQHTEKVEARAFFPSKTFAHDVSNSPAKTEQLATHTNSIRNPPGRKDPRRHLILLRAHPHWKDVWALGRPITNVRKSIWENGNPGGGSRPPWSKPYHKNSLFLAKREPQNAFLTTNIMRLRQG